MANSVTRRGFLKLGAASAASAATPVKADEIRSLTGAVIDRSSGRGLPGVRISNGRDIVISGEDGRYLLAMQPNDIAFIVKPEGFAPIPDARQIPQIHAPLGATQHDFLLERQHEPARFDVLMMADPQPGNNDELGFLSGLVSRAAERGDFRFVLTLGDLVGDKPELYNAYDQLMAQIGAPVWNLPGNHDFDFAAPDAHAARKLWRERYGPGTFAFDYGPATFIMVDNIGWGVRGSRHAYIGEIGSANLEFIGALLDTTPKDRLIVLCMHIPLVSAAEPGDLSCHTHDRGRLMALLAGRRCISFSGHMHTFERHLIPTSDGTHDHRVLNAVCGSWWSGPFDVQGYPVAQSCDGTPNGWYVLQIDGAEARLRFIDARNSSGARIMLAHGDTEDCTLLPQRIAHSALKDARIFVNVFDGGPRTRVAYRLSSRAAQPMQRVEAVDPSTQALFKLAGGTLKPWASASPSTHLWRAPLPVDLSAGAYRIDVTITRDDGSAHKSAHVFEVLQA